MKPHWQENHDSVTEGRDAKIRQSLAYDRLEMIPQDKSDTTITEHADEFYYQRFNREQIL